MNSKFNKNSVNERIWVVKAGSQMVVDGGPLLIRDWMRQVASLQKEGIRIVWVTSGAIASARERLPHFSSATTQPITTPEAPARSRKPIRGDLPTQQALSALGQIFVIEQYKLALENLGLQAAQVLLTAEDLAHRSRRQNLTNTLRRLIDWRAIPILNENDAVSTAEIQFGDNDRLSALVARALGAERLVILTDIEGLYDQDPRQNPNAKLLAEVPRVSSQHIKSASNTPGSARGKGGMLSKLLAAQLAGRDGIPVHLVKGDTSKVLLKIHASVASDQSIARQETHPGTWIHNTLAPRDSATQSRSPHRARPTKKSKLQKRKVRRKSA
ncbi:MAG TPA: glutamate 5-kinase [Pseudobdellovibrionaceae bacterium]|nr:glutamate 5-kinase [Pseudobdellovibrionaceae bacterium]